MTAAMRTHEWLDRGGARPPIRAALIRYWMRHHLLRVPVPLTGPNALRPDTPFDPATWVPAFLRALADEAENGLLLLFDMERAWSTARRAVAVGRRRNSRAAGAIDILAAAPLISATSLAAGLGMAGKNAILLLDEFCAEGIAVEVTHRSRRRIFGLAGLTPLRNEVAPPRRPMPGRGRGRPPLHPVETEVPPVQLPEPRLNRIERQEFDYSDLAHWVAQADQAIRQTRRLLDELNRKTAAGPQPSVVPVTTREDAAEAEDAPDVSSETARNDADPVGCAEPDGNLC